MTINKAMEQADSLRPNSISDVLKGRWLADFEGRLLRETKGAGQCPRYPEEGDVPLSAYGEYGEIYVLYLRAMIDFYLGEYESYNNSASVLNTLCDAYKRAQLRAETPPLQSFKIKGGKRA